MSVITLDRIPRWRPDSGQMPVRLVLSDGQHISGDWARAIVAGFPIDLVIAPNDSPLDQALFVGATAAVIEVAEDSQASLDRFAELAKGDVPLFAVARDPSLSLVRALVRAGAHDVIPLPLDIADLETSLGPLRERISKRRVHRVTA